VKFNVSRHGGKHENRASSREAGRAMLVSNGKVGDMNHNALRPSMHPVVCGGVIANRKEIRYCSSHDAEFSHRFTFGRLW
jgi:hypothetical protein